MVITFTLNGENVTVDTPPEKRLIDLLREDFKLYGLKSGCRVGQCGACTILLNGITALSCMIPAFTIKNNEIITIEGFRKTESFRDIQTGFEKASCVPCGYCISGKILCIHALLEENPQPNDSEILSALTGNRCRCDDIHTILNGVRYAALEREARKHRDKT